MTETVRINATLNKELLEKIDFYAEEKMENRSTAIRQLISEGLKQKLLDKVIEKIREHKMTIRQGAELLDIEYWELQEILKEKNTAIIDSTEKEIKERKEHKL